MKKENILLVLALAFVVFILIFSFLRDNYREKMLESTQKEKAIIVRVIQKTSKDDRGGKFKYSINGKDYDFRQSGDFSMLSIGDTVEIEYSIEDNSVARVINKHYMDKYK